MTSNGSGVVIVKVAPSSHFSVRLICHVSHRFPFDFPSVVIHSDGDKNAGNNNNNYRYITPALLFGVMLMLLINVLLSLRARSAASSPLSAANVNLAGSSRAGGGGEIDAGQVSAQLDVVVDQLRLLTDSLQQLQKMLNKRTGP